MNRVVFKLYITGDTVIGQNAIINIEKICSHDTKNVYQLDIIDVLQSPELAEAGGIIVTPALVKTTPNPVCHIVGDLSDTKTILEMLKI